MSSDPGQQVLRQHSPIEEYQLGRVAQIDRSLATSVNFFALMSVLWLVAGSLLGLISAIKFHLPEFLNSEALTFGRARTLHLNMVAYGWSFNAIFAVALWIMHRIAKVEFRQGWVAMLGGIGWNLTLVWGMITIAQGKMTGVEWLEMPREVAPFLGICFLLICLWPVVAFSRRQTQHVYVSQWYILAAVFWLPILYLVAQMMILWFPARGTVQAVANWWFGHNAIGLFLTPVGVAAMYYFIPKVLGRPIHSYYLSVVGFWTFALFYNWAGVHHLIGGPIPVWLQSAGIVASVMMVVPVLVTAINFHYTTATAGSWGHIWRSPTLRFTVFGALNYTLASLIGSLMSLRDINSVTHFTNFTVGHAHHGMHAFLAMALFGALYFMLPRLTRREWPSASLIHAHFWLCAIGIAGYVVVMSIHGWMQGMQWNAAQMTPAQVAVAAYPWNVARSVFGGLLTLGHIVFCVHVIWMLIPRAERRDGPTLLAR
jgi:cytochrome c oxidase cbb3-type subunit 1